MAGNGTTLEFEIRSGQCAPDAVKIPAKIKDRIRQWPGLGDDILVSVRIGGNTRGSSTIGHKEMQNPLGFDHSNGTTWQD